VSAGRRSSLLAAAGLSVLVVGALAAAEPQGAEAERLRSAKALFFDRKYAEAREAWRDVLARSSGAPAATAAYWIARSTESLGDKEGAFREYGEFLARRPADRVLAEEARTSRASLAAQLLKAGRKEYRAPLLEALEDSSRSVRYFAAIQAAGSGECEPATPILRRIVQEEADEDLVQRARLGLLRCDPAGLRGPAAPAPRAPGEPVRWLRVRIHERPGGRAKLSLNIPVALADLVFKSLPEDARVELAKKGYDADNFWERLKRMPPAQILEIEGDDGERIQIWIE
jgi:hypothetical protein